jgi:hypothetical protein
MMLIPVYSLCYFFVTMPDPVSIEGEMTLGPLRNEMIKPRPFRQANCPHN